MKKTILISLAVLTLIGWSFASDYLQLNKTEYISITTVEDAGGSVRNVNTFGITPVYGYKTLISEIILSDAIPAHAGLGNIDTAWIKVQGSIGENYFMIDSNEFEGFPCTLLTVISDDVGDTLLRSSIRAHITISDSLGDTVGTFTYPVKYNVYMK